MNRRSFARAAALACAALLAVPAFAADAFPSKPIRIIVPYTPGGTTDLMARLVAQKLNERLKVPVLVENKPGANGIIGAETVAHSPPDGYTLGIASPGTHAANAFLYKDIHYDTVKDFTPVTLGVIAPMLLVVHPSLNVNNVKELIAAARKNPGGISYASGGSGSSQHLAMELFKMMSGTDMVHVPYKGSAASYTDLLSGRVKTEIDVLPTAMPPGKAGRLKILATGSAKRLAALPEVPTIAESGVPGYEYNSWYGFVAPANLPKNVLDKLNGEIVRALHEPDVEKKLTDAGVVVVANTPQQFGDFIKAEMEKARKIIETAHIQAE